MSGTRQVERNVKRGAFQHIVVVMTGMQSTRGDQFEARSIPLPSSPSLFTSNFLFVCLFVRIFSLFINFFRTFNGQWRVLETRAFSFYS